jgi:hypothetical protein
MSELTQCNHCSLRQIKAEAKREKKIVTLLPGRTLGIRGGAQMRGIDVYVHPRSVKVRELRAHDREQYWEQWFWELSDHCAC